MMITDQIATFVPSPLIGPNPQELGERFPDMSEIYDGKMQQKIRESARALGIPLAGRGLSADERTSRPSRRRRSV